MSVVVYGPQGCGKTRHAELLLKAFKLVIVVDDATGVYRRWAADLKFRRALFLTTEEPPADQRENCQFIPFARALAMARKASGTAPSPAKPDFVFLSGDAELREFGQRRFFVIDPKKGEQP